MAQKHYANANSFSFLLRDSFLKKDESLNSLLLFICINPYIHL